MLDGNFIAGFAAGEGCFHISVVGKRPQVRAMFTIQLRADDVMVLEQIRDTFGCGNVTVYERKSGSPIACFRVGNLPDLVNIIIPFFEKYPLMAKKQTDFDIFKNICWMMVRKEHLTDDGIAIIKSYKEYMNIGYVDDVRELCVDD